MFKKYVSVGLVILILVGTVGSSVWAAPPLPDKLAGVDGVSATPCPDPDPYEDDGGGERDDSFSTASSLTTAGQPGHTFDRYSDKDWVKFEAHPGFLYTIATENLSPPYDPSGFYADTLLELYKSDGVTLIDQSDDYGGTYASRITWQAPEAGVYYVKVVNFNSSVYGCDVEYDLTLTQDSSLQIDKTAEDVNGAPLLAGDVIHYFITVTNASTETQQTNVVITDPIPDGTTFVDRSAHTSKGLILNTSPTLEVGVGTLEPSGVVTVTFDVRVNAGTEGQTIANRAFVSSDQVPSFSTPPVTTPDGGMVSEGLEIAKTAMDMNDDPVEPGDVISYTILVTNSSSIPHTNVVVTDFLPSGTTYVSGSVNIPPGSVVLPVDDLLVIHWGTLQPSDELMIQFAVTVDAGVSYIGANVAVVSSDQQAGQSTGPVYPPGQDLLDFDKQARDLNGGALYPGDEILYTLTVVNLLDEVQTNVVITDAIPDETTYLPGSAWVSQGSVSEPDPLVAELGSLEPGASATFVFRVTVDAGGPNRVIRNYAQAGSDQQRPPLDVGPIEPEPGGGAVEDGEQALGITKLAQDVNGGALYGGDEILYTVSVVNLLSTPQTNVVVTDAIPDDTTYVPDSASVTRGSVSGPDPLVVTIATLQPGEKATLVFRVTVDDGVAGQVIQNSARAGSDQQDPDVFTGPVEPQPSGGTVEDGQQALSILKTAEDINGGPLYVGDEILYTISVVNLLDTSQENVVISDEIPEHADYVLGSASVTLGSTSGPDPLVANVGTLGAGQAATLTFRVTVAEGATDYVVENVAQASSDDQSPPVVTPPIQPYPDPIPGDPSSGGGIVLPDEQHIGISKQAEDVNGPPLAPGDVIKYTISIWNESGMAQSEVSITDYVPDFTTYVPDSLAASDGLLSGPDPLLVNLYSLYDGDFITMAFQVTVDEDAVGQTIANQAFAESDQQDPPAYTPPVTTPGGGTVVSLVEHGIYLPLVMRNTG